MNREEFLSDPKNGVMRIGCNTFVVIFVLAVILKVFGIINIPWVPILLFPILGPVFLFIFRAIILPILCKIRHFWDWF